MKNQVSILFVLSTLIAMVFFQNCEKPQSKQDLSTLNSSISPSFLDSSPLPTYSNGQPYDGKLFVRNKDCPDGTLVESRIVLGANSTDATLSRENCQTSTPEPIAISQIRLDAQNLNSIFYKDQEFIMEKPAIPLPGVVSWYYQLTGLLGIRPPSIYIVDMYDHTASEISDLKKSGHTVICTISAGTVEAWNPDADQFPGNAIGNQVQAGAGERWIDTQNQIVRSVMLARLDLARGKGCHGINFDNADGYANVTGFSLTKNTQLEYNQFLAFAAHDRSLILSVNNAPEIAPEQANIFDFAVAEECFKYGECLSYQPFIQRRKPVLNAEYGPLSQAQCSSASSLFISLAYFSSKLDGSRYEICPIQ